MRPLDYRPPFGPLQIIWRDDWILAVSKPPGLLTVPGKHPSHSECLHSRVNAVYPKALLVHRLDMDTSGLVLFAMNKEAQRHLGLQFERRHISKTYEALVGGSLDVEQGEISLPLTADWPNRPLQKVCHSSGKSSLTRYQVITRCKDAARVRLFPETGRSHQLRVHMKEIGHPILGDRFYGGRFADRLMLHAIQLSFRHPSGGRVVELTSPIGF
jgi:tRNA pseudouridine32 synthase/23S rRNA pseudouridine746 synthase